MGTIFTQWVHCHSLHGTNNHTWMMSHTKKKDNEREKWPSALTSYCHLSSKLVRKHSMHVFYSGGCFIYCYWRIDLVSSPTSLPQPDTMALAGVCVVSAVKIQERTSTTVKNSIYIRTCFDSLALTNEIHQLTVEQVWVIFYVLFVPMTKGVLYREIKLQYV